MKQMLNVLKLLKPVFLSISIFTIGCTHNLEIDRNQFNYDNKPFKMWGIRVASASQNEENTKLLLSSLDNYKENGINTISVFFQGSSGGFSDPFSEDGKTIDQEHLDRMIRIIEACQSRDMVVIAGIFYQRTMGNLNGSRRIADRDAVVNAVRLVTEKLKPFRNVIINIANEQNSGGYKEFTSFDFSDPENIIILCREVHLIDPERITGGGGYKD